MATLKARGAHEVARATIERPKEERAHPYKEGWTEIRWTKRFRAIRSDGAILEKVQSYERNRAPDGTESRGYCPSAAYKLAGTLKAGITADRWRAMYEPKGWTVEILAPFPADAMAPKAAQPEGSPPPALESVQASYARHAPLTSGFKGDRPPPVPAGPWRSDWADGPGRVQSTTGGGLDAGLGGGTYARGLSPGPFYAAMTYLTGRQSPAPGRRYGEPATHAQLWPIALKLFEDPDGIRAAWLYDAGNGRWEPCFTPRCPEMDPCHVYMDDPGRRLRALLARATGAECHDDGARFCATADLGA